MELKLFTSNVNWNTFNDVLKLGSVLVQRIGTFCTSTCKNDTNIDSSICTDTQGT